MIVKLAGCVILDDQEKIFLLHRNKKGVTQWELPGGKIDSGEEAREAAIRELEEELGVAVRIVRSLGGTHFTENDVEYEYEWFLAEIESGELRICEPESFDDLRAFTISEMANLALSNNMKKLYQRIRDGKVQYTKAQ